MTNPLPTRIDFANAERQYATQLADIEQICEDALSEADICNAYADFLLNGGKEADQEYKAILDEYLAIKHGDKPIYGAYHFLV